MNLISSIEQFLAGLRAGNLSEVGFWGYVLLAALVAVEGPMATLLGAAAASAGLMKPWSVLFSASVGNMTADVLWYTLGYFGKIEWIFRAGHGLGLSRAKMERLEQMMQAHATKMLFLAKLTMTFMIPSLIAVGLVRVPWRRWFPAVFTGEMIWTGSLVVIGFYTTEAIKRVEQGVESVILLGSVAFLVFTVWMGRHLLNMPE